MWRRASARHRQRDRYTVWVWRSAARQCGVHGGDQVVDADRAVAVAIGGGALVDGVLAEGDADGAHQVVDGDRAVAAAIAGAGAVDEQLGPGAAVVGAEEHPAVDRGEA